MLTAFVSALHEVTRPMRFLVFSEDDGRETVLQHIATIEAIEVQGRDGAEAAMLEHLTCPAGVAVRAQAGE
jgi:DNA-binding GntR family transcriptional regulator